MTREEAIGNLIHAIRWNDMPTKEALDMAIKALEQGPCEDCISRAFLIDRLLEKVKTRRSTIEICNKLIPLIKGLPSVQPKAGQESKAGHWEYVQYDYNPKFGNLHCSECRCVFIECVNKEDKDGIPLYKYCPQCGAKMVEPQESEDKE